MMKLNHDDGGCGGGVCVGGNVSDRYDANDGGDNRG